VTTPTALKYALRSGRGALGKKQNQPLGVDEARGVDELPDAHAEVIAYHQSSPTLEHNQAGVR
jgi:hypothetical protein